MNDKNQSTGLGMIIRNFKSEIQASSCCNRSFLHQPAIVEVYALHKAMLICHDLGITMGIYEGDYKYLVTAVNSKEDLHSAIYPLICDIKVLLQHHPTWRVHFNNRDTKKFVHHLAKLTYSIQRDSDWIREYPMQIMSYVLGDISL